MNKNELREFYAKKRKSFSKEERDILSKKALDNLLKQDEYKKAKTIFAFVSFRDEIDTQIAIRKFLQDGKSVCIPVTEKGSPRMKFTKINSLDDLVIGHFGILSPKDEDLDFVDYNTADLVLVPGLVFDDDGYRIGYGGGFYDRFFDELENTPVKIGFCFSFQRIDKLPIDKYDLPVDMVITD